MYLIFITLLLLMRINASGLVDNPIVGDAITYLDSSSWVATAAGSSDKCTFEMKTDFKHGAGGGDGVMISDVDSKEMCCGLCEASSSCAAATWCEPQSGCDDQCWMKKAADISGGSYSRNGRIGCVKKDSRDGYVPEFSMPGKVPGDLLTDLQNAGLIGDPLYEKNFKNATMWSKVWTYTTAFQLTETALASQLLLVFDGIKMGASIRVNGVEVGQAKDQFLRYVFHLKPDIHTLVVGANKLEVVFQPDINVNGRFMACTGGWDWAPYTTTKQNGVPTFSKGIWKSVYIVEYSSVSLTDVVPEIFYKGSYPTSPLEKGKHGDFQVHMKVFFEASSATKGTLKVNGSWGATAKLDVTVPTGNNSVSINITAAAKDIDLWWPVGWYPEGLGGQPLYHIDVIFTPSSSSGNLEKELTASRRVGFRYFALVTGNDTDPAYVKRAKTEQGTEDHGMYFRVNGAVVWARGANMIPMEELEGRMDAAAHRRLAKSAAEAGMNILRVWGGGIFLPQEFYDACDEYGIMVFQDMQYAQGGHAPKVSATQDAELRHNVRRLSAHPSIVMWDGCNECRVIIGTDTGIYATFVMTVVAQEDKSRTIWPSCPALGWTAGVNKLDSTPNGQALLTPKSGKTIETHGPYQHGNGFPAMNGNNALKMFDSKIPLEIDTVQMGPQFQNVFASEFGTVVMSSFESMSPLLESKHWALEAGVAPDDCTGGWNKKCEGDNPMAERNYPCNNIIAVYFGNQEKFFNKTGEAPFKQQLYQCMVGQALNIKANIEHRRNTNSFGCIVWQYNEIWPTGGWGSIEYGTPVNGQILGGRWKPLQYWYQSSIYKDVMATCGQNGQCYVKNDSPFRFVGHLTLMVISFEDGATLYSGGKKLLMAPGAGTTEYFKLNYTIDGTKSILVADIVEGEADTPHSRNIIPFATPEKMILPSAKVTFVVGQQKGDKTVPITVSSDNVALYVTLTTAASGRFSDNTFFMCPSCGVQPHESSNRTSHAVVNFIPWGPLQLDLLKSSLRVEHVAAYK